MGRKYDNPNFSGIHVVGLGLLTANASADTAQGRFASYMDAKITEVHCVIQGLGTADASGWTIKNGTTSVGTITQGTAATGTIAAATLTDQPFTATDVLNITNIGSDTTQSAFLFVTYQENFVNT